MRPSDAQSAQCTLCHEARRFRRGLCRACHHKLSACDLPLPPDGRTLRQPWPIERWLVTLVAALGPSARAALREALETEQANG